MILASLWIAQIAELCVGLARTLGARVGRAEDAMTPTLRALSYEIGAEAVSMLRDAAGAWVALDVELARGVLVAAEQARSLQRQAFRELLSVEGASTEAVVDLGMAARAYERITDHAAEIAGRVMFVAGSPVSRSGPWPQPNA
jgi:phosphate uptake regulator